MSTALLIGAGFSRNWGGWLASEVFEYLLGCPEVIANKQVQQLLWQHKDKGGFEAALAEVQLRWTRDPRASQSELDAIQGAIARLFTDMNGALLSISNFEFQQDRSFLVAAALTKFDAIFTLNQDLLLEHHYLNDNVCLLSDRRWDGYQLPGLTPHPSAGLQHVQTPARVSSTHRSSQPSFDWSTGRNPSSSFTDHRTGSNALADRSWSWVGGRRRRSSSTRS